MKKEKKKKGGGTRERGTEIQRTAKTENGKPPKSKTKENYFSGSQPPCFLLFSLSLSLSLSFFLSYLFIYLLIYFSFSLSQPDAAGGVTRGCDQTHSIGDQRAAGDRVLMA